MSEKLQVSGTIKQIGVTASYGSKGFLKREFILETTGDKYPQPIKFEVVQDNCDKLDKHREGQQATVHFNLRGNEHNGKFYVSLVAWRLEVEGGQPDPVASPKQTLSAMADQHQTGDDIPF
jgi:hypothetical protein